MNLKEKLYKKFKMKKELTKLEKEVLSKELDFLMKEYSNIFLRTKRANLDKGVIFLEGILVAILTNYIISFIIQFQSKSVFLFYTKLILFILAILVLILIVLNIYKEINQLRDNIKDLKDFHDIKFEKLLDLIEKSKGKEYAKKFALYAIAHTQEQIRRAKLQ